MRILMLSQFYPPIIGGEEQHVRTLSIELVARGHDVVVVTLEHQGLPTFELDQSVRVYRIHSSIQRIPRLFSDNGRRYAPPFPDPELVLALRRIVMQERPEIVHAHNWLVHSFLPLKTWSKARLIVTLHNYNLVCAKTTLLHQQKLCDGPGAIKCLSCSKEFYGLMKGTSTLLGTQLMGMAERRVVDMFLTVSQAVAVGNGLVGGRQAFQVIPNFMPDDVSVLQGDAEPYVRQLPAEGYLLFVGAFNRQKGLDVLLHAYAALSNAPPLVLIGYRTPEWEQLAMQNLDNVFVLTNWPRYAVMEAWRRSAVAIAPSVGPEACCTAVMEAMVSGCPVIASHIGGMVDLVAEGETGLLFEPGNVSALQQAMERLLQDADLRSRMGQAARRRGLPFQASTVVPQIEQVYRQVVL
jgi:glycosyltransferase involved in cell wall biosynthesis